MRCHLIAVLGVSLLGACSDLEPADVAGTYLQDGDCTGTAENPGCDSQLFLDVDGTGYVVFDDIIEDLHWTLSAATVHIDMPGWGPTDFMVMDGADLLIDARYHGHWVRQSSELRP